MKDNATCMGELRNVYRVSEEKPAEDWHWNSFDCEQRPVDVLKM
jgi:hypothetical protein